MRSSSGPGIVSDRVRGADEQHLREVERQVEVVVAERRCSAPGRAPRASREEGSPRQSAPILSISSIRSSGFDDSASRSERMIVPGHRADVRAPVAADLRLVAHAADRHAHELAAERARDRLAERGLADAGRADEAEDLARDLVAQLRDREVLDDPLLDLVEVEVVVVEDLAGVVEVEVVLGVRAPRQRDDPLEVGADHAVLGRRLRQPLEPRRARGRRPSRTSSGSVSASMPLAQLVDLGLLGVALAELRAGSPSAAGAGSTRAGPSPSPTGPATGSSSRARTPRARG